MTLSKYLVTIETPRFLTTNESFTLGAKNLLEVAWIIMRYRRKYITFTVKVV